MEGVKKKKYKRIVNADINVNSQAEVFVIPPNLLEKLGINLGSLNSGQGITENISTPQEPLVENNQNQDNSNVNDKSSILETADLMKASVFCSPTFTHNVGNSSIDDDYINENVPSVNIAEYANGSAIEYCNTNGILNEENNTVNPSLDTLPINIPIVTTDHVSIDKIPDVNKIRENSAPLMIEYKMEEVKTNGIYNNEEHTDETYITDFINSNIDINAAKTRNSINNSHKNRKNSITIISEQILNPSQLEEIQNSCAANNITFRPVPMDSIITKKGLNNGNLNTICKNITVNTSIKDTNEIATNNVEPPKDNSKELPPICEINKNVQLDSQNNKLVTNELKDCGPSNDTRESNLKSPKPVLATSEINCKETIPTYKKDKIINKNSERSKDREKHADVRNTRDVSSNNQHEKLEKVKEIANYLNQINKKHKILKQNKSLPHQKSNAIQSKLPIHGVEKPGGGENGRNKCNNTIITYKPAKCKKQIPILKSQPNDKINVDSITLPTNSFNKQLNASHTTHCICYDFGQFAFYETDEYEHIHFWEHTSTDSDPETIFSIYNENTEGNHKHELMENPVVDTNTDNGDIILDNNVCWGNINIETSDISDNLLDTIDVVSTKCEDEDLKSKIKRRASRTNKSTSIQTNASKESMKVDNRDPVPGKYKGIIESDQSPKIKAGSKIITSTPKFTSKSKDANPPQTLEDTTKSKIIIDSDDQNIQMTKVIENRSLENKSIKSDKKSQKANIDKDPSPINDSKTKRRCSVIEKKTYDKPTKDRTENVLSKEINNKSLTKKYQNTLIVDLSQKNSEGVKAISESNVTNTETQKVSIELNENIPIKEIKQEPQIENRTNIESPVQTSQSDSDSKSMCGVCKVYVEDSLWNDHISKKHNYLAWKDSEEPLNLNDEESVRQHLQIISNKIGGLVCSKCGLVRKHVKKYLNHINRCDVSEATSDNLQTVDDTKEFDKSMKSSRKRKPAVTLVTCGVCNQSVNSKDWTEHIRNEHDYLAWHTGEDPLNLNDEVEVKAHLNTISKYNGGLVCKKCGIVRKYVKHYLDHIDTCDGTRPDLNETADTDTSALDKTVEANSNPIVVCAVCKEEVAKKGWIKHITKEHKYMAWVEGETPLNLDDDEQMYQHFYRVMKEAGELLCFKCGFTRRYAKPFLQHFRVCDYDNIVQDVKIEIELEPDEYICGVCNLKGKLKRFKEHAMEKHYNIAWKLGDMPINYRNIYGVLKYIKEYNDKHKLVCKNCGLSRTSHFGFCAHILTCGKSEEELKPLYDMCDVCNNKYLCIYKNQHMAMHREKEQRLLKRKMQEDLAEEKKKQALEEPVLGNRRRAAEKAKKEIESFVDGNENKELNSDDSDVDVTVKMEPESGECTDDEAVPSDASNDEETLEPKKKKKKRSEGSKIERIPFKITNYHAYVKKSYQDFCELNISTGTLFDNYRHTNIEIVPEKEAIKYLPCIKESCKFKLIIGEWTTLKRFEARYINGINAFFSGGCIRSASWAPAQNPHEADGHYLAVNTHAASDVPQYTVKQLIEHSGMLQIWKYRDFVSPPKFQLGLLHDYGTVWAFDWCPSGAQDILPDTEDLDRNKYRLGLIAIACSNGLAYITSVPYPNDGEETQFVRIKPLIELRLSMSSERRLYQATSLFWDIQKGHEFIMVGYADGTTAQYDLNTENPFLRTEENGITILYPYEERRPENCPITGVCSSAHGGRWWCGAAGGGGGAGGRRATLAGVGATALTPYPHWPAVVMLSDMGLSLNTCNELEVWSAGRRAGGAAAGGACARCGALALHAPPALRLLRPPPAHPDARKKNIAMLRMIQLGRKRKHQKNDDISMVLQPRTYEEAITTYGLELTMVPKSDPISSKMCTENEQLPERYPLSDVTTLAFCPSDQYHRRLAMGTHPGLLFIIST